MPWEGGRSESRDVVLCRASSPPGPARSIAVVISLESSVIGASIGDQNESCWGERWKTCFGRFSQGPAHSAPAVNQCPICTMQLASRQSLRNHGHKPSNSTVLLTNCNTTYWWPLEADISLPKLGGVEGPRREWDPLPLRRGAFTPPSPPQSRQPTEHRGPRPQEVKQTL